MTAPNPAAVALGKIKSTKKAAASRENGKRGGRPILISLRNPKDGKWTVHKVGPATVETLAGDPDVRKPTPKERAAWTAAQ